MDTLETIAQEIRDCRACALCESATNPVPGEGPVTARVMFIGEGPGAHEDRLGRPFLGASGRVLDSLLVRAGLDRTRVFIANVVKHRPPDNRDPLPAEVDACLPFLRRQIRLIKPRVVVPLGRHAAARWIPDVRITQVHGVPHIVKNVVVIPMLHPATALYQPSNRAILEADFVALGEYINTHFPDATV